MSISTSTATSAWKRWRGWQAFPHIISTAYSTPFVGESPGNYVKQWRLTAAARRLLLAPEPSVSRVALDCGFSSPSDFTRSFKARFGLSPSQYARSKAKKEILKAGADGRIAAAKLTTLPDYRPGHGRPVEIRELPDLLVAYIRRTGLSPTFREKGIEEAYARLFKWAKARGLMRAETRVLGVTLDSPEVVPLECCRYDACLTVPEGIAPDGEIGIRRVPAAGRYAACRFRRDEPGFHEVFFAMTSYIYGVWLPDHGFLPADRPFLEFYAADQSTGETTMDFYLPVTPL